MKDEVYKEESIHFIWNTQTVQAPLEATVQEKEMRAEEYEGVPSGKKKCALDWRFPIGNSIADEDPHAARSNADGKA